MVAIAAIVLLSVTAIGWQIRKESRRLHRKEKLLCQRCGYDLRAQHEECPECGLPINLALPKTELPFDLRQLQGDWPVDAIEPRLPELGELRVVIHSSWNRREVNLVADQMQARGVWCRVESKQVSDHRGAVVFTSPVYAAVVLAGDEAIARTIPDRFRAAPMPGDASSDKLPIG